MSEDQRNLADFIEDPDNFPDYPGGPSPAFSRALHQHKRPREDGTMAVWSCLRDDCGGADS